MNEKRIYLWDRFILICDLVYFAHVDSMRLPVAGKGQVKLLVQFGIDKIEVACSWYENNKRIYFQNKKPIKYCQMEIKCEYAVSNIIYKEKTQHIENIDLKV